MKLSDIEAEKDEEEGGEKVGEDEKHPGCVVTSLV